MSVVPRAPSIRLRTPISGGSQPPVRWTFHVPSSATSRFCASGAVNTPAMRVVVVGATGNVGTSLLDALAAEPAVDSVLGVARRAPELEVSKVDWAQADVTGDD